MRSLGNSYTGEFDKCRLWCWSGISCFVSMETDAGVGNEASGAESTSSPQNVRSACLLGQSRGCSLPHPRVMGAGSGLCSTRLQQLLAFFGLWLHDSSLCLHLHNDFVCGGGVWMCVFVCVCVCVWLHDSSLCLHLHNDFVCVGGRGMDVCVCVCVHTCMHARTLCVVWNLSLWYEILLCLCYKDMYEVTGTWN